LPRVVVIDDEKKMLGEMNTQDAIRLAKERGYDLVEVSPLARPPVCRIMDFGKFIYERKRRERASRKKQKVISIREIWLSLKISDHDYQVKLRKTIELLEGGDKVKVSLVLRGRIGWSRT
jgi:translation initiation factor IF-3